MRLLTSALVAMTLVSQTSAFAAVGYHVQQTVLFDGASKSEAIVNWRVTDKEFRADVTRGNDTRNFVFNGRTFYVCGKLSPTQLSFLKKLQIDDQKLMDSLRVGVCQELAIDFALRFFMNPYEAIGDIELSGGFGATLDLENLEVNLTGSAAAVDGVKCVDVKRSFSLQDKKDAKVQRTITESLCNAPAIKWRQAFGRELGMAMIRQPGGKKTFDALTTDLKKLAGMSLKASGKVSGTGVGGKAINSSYEVSSSKAGVSDVTEIEVSMPRAFAIIDPKNLNALAAKAKIPKMPGTQTPSAGDVVRALILGATF